MESSEMACHCTSVSERFETACQKVLAGNHAKRGIGTLGEKTLHAVLKRYMEPYEDSHEVKIGGFVADIVSEHGIVEVQTQGFDKLRRKLEAFLSVTNVTVVYPIAATKWLVWIDPATGEVTTRRKSPRRGTVQDAFFELYKIKMFLNDERLRLHFVLLDIEEHRLLDGWSKDKKRGSHRYERIPVRLVDKVLVECAADYEKLLPANLPDEFTSKDYKKASGLPLHGAQTALNVLATVGAVTNIGKQGRLNLYHVGGTSK